MWGQTLSQLAMSFSAHVAIWGYACAVQAKTIFCCSQVIEKRYVLRDGNQVCRFSSFFFSFLLV